MTPQNDVIDAEIVVEPVAADGVPELVAADEALLAVGAAVAEARADLGRARLVLLNLEIALADLDKRITGCPCGCGITGA